ncbi:hypothetical protein KEM48_000092 [Puccinia striiformis f. sp. tritici PST-130]|nr:hypothetical protein KEM48_000092 [Puccinia striiformis f. sp. tritici PST-130]
MPTRFQPSPRGRCIYGNSLNDSCSTTDKHTCGSGPSRGSRPQVEIQKGEVIFPDPDNIQSIQTNLVDWKWDDLRTEIIRILHESRLHLKAYIDVVTRAGKLRWHFHIHGSHIYPSKKEYCVSSKDQFRPFAEEVAREAVKTKKIAEHQNDSLAIAVGEAEAIIPLQRLQARTTINPNADTSGDPLAACVSKLRKHLQGKSPSKPLEAIFLSDPARPGWALRVHHDRLWAWARVLEQKEAGNITEANQNVDYDTPPSGPFFSWEPRASVSPVRHIAGQITHHTPTNTTPQAHTSAP